MKTIIQSVKGTRDFYPEEMGLRNWLYQTIRQVSESFGYQEYEGPFLESIELYAAKSGDELVKEQAYVFPDRGGDMITLRPELTPTLARMVAQRQRQLIYPLRWWSWGPCWRYERPQKGRAREFFQWNIDLIGVDTAEADAEMLAIAATFLRETGLKPEQVSILVNNRKLMEEQLVALGIAQQLRPEIFRLIDRREKMADEAWEANALEIGLSAAQLDGLTRILNDQGLWQASPGMRRTFELLDALGVSEYVHYKPSIIRGLDYYTGTVFETWDCDGEFRAILGGGRYDNLVSDVGGDPLPATGFAMGDMVISLVLKKFGCVPPGLGSAPANILVTIFDESLAQASQSLAAWLRSAGFNVICYPEPGKLARQFKYADRLGIRLALVLGPDEVAFGNVTIKDLKTAAQQSVALSGASQAIAEMLENRPAS